MLATPWHYKVRSDLLILGRGEMKKVSDENKNWHENLCFQKILIYPASTHTFMGKKKGGRGGSHLIMYS